MNIKFLYKITTVCQEVNTANKQYQACGIYGCHNSGV